ncbi:AI-2E family transporter [Enterococcus timonensis]|uniref:AI-2E family transporter n=1 Tax=Enterococcus timonensis TaxID=1852364 RepID=UPI0008D9A822|nr:AI-2E family transporter [Enterococcus timonensis]
MLDKVRNSKIMFWSLELLIIATLIFVSQKIDGIFDPIATFFSTLFAPILIAGFLFYVLNPLVNLLEKIKIKRVWGTVIVFILLIAIIVIASLTFIPYLISQISTLVENAPETAKQIETWARGIAEEPFLKDLDLEQYINQIDLSYSEILTNLFKGISGGIGSIFSTVASAVVVLVTAPFVLFYMLKDGERLQPAIEKITPEKSRKDVITLLGQMNDTIATYISGQAIESLFVATFTFIGYSIIGVDYALLFGVIAGLTNLIPYIGPYLGLLPAVLVTVFDSPIKALLCCLVVLIVQQLDGNIIYPNVIGKKLKIHPLTIILILLVAGNLSGLLGIFLGVPIYAVARTIVIYVFNIYKLRKGEVKSQSQRPRVYRR